MKRLFTAILILWPLAAPAQDSLTVSAPPDLVEAGLVQHLLPRFGLKHGIRASLVEGPAAVTFGDNGIPVFVGLDRTWAMQQDGSALAQRFADWLRSDVGRRTIEGFTPDGGAPFSAEVRVAEPVAPTVFDGDPEAGAKLSLVHCGRCHVIGAVNRSGGLGSTPSFGMLRTLADWENRFTGFYALNPHPSFTQVTDLTPPFDPQRPPPIVPMTLTQDDIDAITAFVATIPPADLGAPVLSR